MVKENVKRLMRATITAGGQAGAVFRTSATWPMRGSTPQEDFIAKMAVDCGGNVTA